jgi:replicative DNA helicase
VGRAVLDALDTADATGQSLDATLEATPGGAEALQRVRAYADNLVLVRALGAHTTLDEIDQLIRDHTEPSRRTVVFVDYLQKIPVLPEPEFEAEKVTRTVEGLKDLALEHHVPIVLISAVDRPGLEVNRIRMHHLRGSSALAFEADVVLMLNDKHKAVSKVHLAYDANASRTFRDWVVFSMEKNRGGPNLIDLEFRKDFSHYRFDPEGGLVSERLVDERLDEHEL